MLGEEEDVPNDAPRAGPYVSPALPPPPAVNSPVDIALPHHEPMQSTAPSLPHGDAGHPTPELPHALLHAPCTEHEADSHSASGAEGLMPSTPVTGIEVEGDTPVGEAVNDIMAAVSRLEDQGRLVEASALMARSMRPAQSAPS